MRRVGAVLTGQFQREVAAERVAGNRERRQPIDLGQLVYHVRGVGGQPGMKQPARQVLGPAAVPLVQPDRVHAAGERLGGKTAHVVRIARSIQAVQGDQRGSRPRFRLPVAVRQHPRVAVDLE